MKIEDFISERHCRWFILSKAKSGPNLRYACTMCACISKTKECPAFKDHPPAPSLKQNTA